MNVLCLHLCEPGRHWKAPHSASRLHWIHVGTVSEALLLVRNAGVNVVVIDAPAPTDRADDILLELLRADPGVPVVFACSEAGSDDIIRLIRLGAWHVWNGDSDPERITSTIEAAGLSNLEARQRRHSSSREEPWRNLLVGQSEGMQRMLDVIRLVAARRSSVLITGETGTGKEVVARAIHQAGGRGHMPFVAVNCSAIPATLIEAELFGHVRGAFTGAAVSRAGRFEQANGGTIFLDEIGDLPLELQAKLLRVLQEREVQRLGSSETTRLNVRVLAATNIDLEQAVEQRLFREDLYYRLNVVPLHIPPLRERTADIPALADHFTARVCHNEGLPLKRLAAGVVDRLRAHPWPGNVRQLEHAIETAVVLSGDRDVVEAGDFPVLRAGTSTPAAAASLTAETLVSDKGLDFEATVSRLEWSLIQQALALSNGNKARAAELLRMKRTTLLARVRSLEERRESVVMAACA
ncbi:MAG: sigma-54 dependent transcriptional regulator [Bryobacteraceae bacterium]|nr:sigma-54 dependent transcriptional regulator [Bryobacteraceae bacterium]